MIRNNKKKKVAVLISGNGGNLQALIDACRNPAYPAEIKLVISNKRDVFGIKRAQNSMIPVEVIEHKIFSTREEFDAEIHKKLIEHNIEIVCLAGFMRILTKEFVEKWEGKMLNIHPSLLPSFKGANGVKDALEYGVKITGCTVHLVVPEIDSGKILVQRSIEISSNDNESSLATKIHQQEHIAYPEALKILCDNI